MSGNSRVELSNLRTQARGLIRRVSENVTSKALQNPQIRGLAFDALHLLTDSASADIDGLHYTFSTDDWIIGRSLYIKGGWDDEFLEHAVDLLCERANSRPFSEGTFVDIGANIGTTTVPALHRYHARRAIAVEPSPRCLPYLYSNLAANRLASRCDVVEAALSDRSGEVAFKAGENNSGAGQVIAKDGTQDHVVKSQRLDDVITALNAAMTNSPLCGSTQRGMSIECLVVRRK